MKKTFALEELDCANCAAKLERAVSKLEGVQGVTISFLTQKLTLEAADEAFDSVFEQVKKTFKKLEPGGQLYERRFGKMDVGMQLVDVSAKTVSAVIPLSSQISRFAASSGFSSSSPPPAMNCHCTGFARRNTQYKV